MDVASLTKYAFIVQTNCPMWPNHCVMVEHPLGEYVKLADIKEASINNKQQLKSAIALMLRGARCLGDGDKYDSFIESLRLIEQQADI